MILDATSNEDGDINKEYKNFFSGVHTNKELLSNLKWFSDVETRKKYIKYIYDYFKNNKE
jgi:hypothetical protein